MTANPAATGTATDTKITVPEMDSPMLFVTDPAILLPNGASHWNVELFTSVVTRPGSDKPYENIVLLFEEMMLDQIDGFCFHRMLAEYSKLIGRPVTVTTHSLMERMYDYREMTVANTDVYTINGAFGDESAVHIHLVTRDYFVGQEAEGHDAWLHLMCLSYDFDFEFAPADIDKIPSSLDEFFALEATHSTFDYVVIKTTTENGVMDRHQPVNKR